VVKCLAAAIMVISTMAMSVGLAAPAPAAPLAATTCPPYGPCITVTITVTPNAVPPGGTITVTISGTAFNVTFTIVLASTPVTLGTVTTNAAGNGSAAFTVPVGTPPGAHTVTATENSAPSVTASTGLTVLAVAAPVSAAPSSTIPVTGAEVGGIIMVGAAAIGAGGFLVLAARRRRRNSWNSPGL
jgi:hypothetical protein